MKMPGNMQAMMQQAQKMQQKMQEEVALIRVEGSSGGGMVTIKMDGHKNVTGVKIDPEVAGDVEMLQDLVQAACNEATKKVDEESQKKMSGMLGGLPTVSVGDVTAHELATELGTVLEWQHGGVSFVLAGSVSPADAEAAAGALG